MSEKRRWFRTQPRTFAARGAKIYADARAQPIDCTVVDISAGGACLELSRPEAVPPRFEFLHGGIRKPSHLVWRRGFRIGISFPPSAQKSGFSALSSSLSRRPGDRR